MSEINRFKSKITRCPSCGGNEFESSGKSKGDRYMVQDDEIECMNCGRFAVVYCFDGFCNPHWHKK
jgi:uncharacterized protein with PIN domain